MVYEAYMGAYSGLSFIYFFVNNTLNAWDTAAPRLQSEAFHAQIIYLSMILNCFKTLYDEFESESE